MADSKYETLVLAKVSEIRARHTDFGTKTLHGTPPGDWFREWMTDIGWLLEALGTKTVVERKAR